MTKGATKVAITGYAFKPATITVAAGTKITFTNSRPDGPHGDEHQAGL